MEIKLTFLQPAFLLLLPLLFAFVIFLGLRQKNRRLFRRIFAIAVRSLVCVLLVFALAGANVRSFVEDTATVFALDLSDSVTDKAYSMEFVREGMGGRAKNDAAGAVAFGAGAVIEAMPSKGYALNEMQSYVDSQYTDIGAALRLAKSILPEQAQKRIVLLSDGLENAGSAMEAAKELRGTGIPVDIVAVPDGLQDEAQISALRIPKTIRMGMEYDIEVSVYSIGDNRGTINIYKNNEMIVSSDLSLRAGDNQFVFRDICGRGGGMMYRAEMTPEKDTYGENNFAYAYSRVADAPSVLILEKDNSGSEMENILLQSSVVVTKTDAMAAPARLDMLSAYDAVILADVSIDDLPEGFDILLESYVKNTGGGVLAAGGENSFALGGYYETAIEKLLPVEMQLKSQDDMPQMGMIVVIDRSGSMTGGNYGVSKIALAKEALIRAIDALTDTDSFGVIAFDETYSWAVDFAAAAGRQEEMKTRVAQITGGSGGTSILPALGEAVDTLKDMDLKRKHIILLTDGRAEQSGYEKALETMAEAGITLSSVAVGGDSDQVLLKELAQKGAGRYYYTDAFTDLPQIFAKETFLAGKPYLNNRSFLPRVNTLSRILLDWDENGGAGQIDGYVSTTAKKTAEVVLQSDTNEPILAVWQYGLGRTAAWTSDVSGRWTAEFLAGASGAAVLRNTVSWALRKDTLMNAALDVENAGTQSEVKLTTDYADGVLAVTGVLIGRDSEEITMEFAASEPGVFAAVSDEILPGVYMASLQLQREDGVDSFITGVSVPYSREYDVRSHSLGKALLNKIADETGGRILTEASQVFAPMQNRAFGDRDASGDCLLLALVLFLFDIYTRKFSFLADNSEKALESVRLRMRQRGTQRPRQNKEVKKNNTNDELMNEDIAHNKDHKAAAETSSQLLDYKKKRTGGGV